MSFHMLAYSASVNSAAFTDTTPVNDTVYQIQNGHFLLPTPKRLIFGQHLATSALAMRLVSPRIRQVTTTNLIGVSNRQATMLTQARVADYRNNMPMLSPLEELECDTLNDAGGAERQNAIFGVCDQLTPQPQGDTFGFLGTSVTAAVASTWTPITMTWNDLLPNGRYAIVGLKHSSASAIACRLFIPNQVDRPGCISSINRYDDTDPMFRRGGLGIWGTFENTNMPRPEVLCNTTDNAHTIVMDIVKIG